MRDQLISAISAAISSSNQFAVSTELPWSQDGQPLYLKNKRKIYVDKTRMEQTTLLALVGPGLDVYQNDYIADAYVAVDAKTPPSQLDSVITQILSAKDFTGIVNFGTESDYTVDKQEDVLIFTFQFRLNVATI